MMMDYLWNIRRTHLLPADVESQREAIAANLMQNLFEVSDYQILAAGPDQVGSAGAYQIYLEGTDSEASPTKWSLWRWRGMISAVISSSRAIPRGQSRRSGNPFHHPVLESNGAPETTYKMYYGSKSGVKVIVDDAVAAGRVMDTTVNLGEAGAAAELVFTQRTRQWKPALGALRRTAGLWK